MTTKYVGVLGEIQAAYEITHWQEYKIETPSNLDIVECLLSEYVPHYFTDLKLVSNYSDEIGEQCWVVIQWKGEYYRLPYFHKSHYGTDYYGDGSNLVKVVPKEVTQTIYV